MDENLANIRHERSKKDFPALKLNEGEYVEYVFSRAKICYAAIWGIVAAALTAIILAFYFTSKHPIGSALEGFIPILCVAFAAFFVIGGMLATKVYNCNKLFVTNKRVIQYIMLSPMVSSKNVIDLSGIEDVSFSQHSILQKIFKIGTLRLSTVGDETTYTLQNTEYPGDDMNEIMRLIRDSKESLQTPKNPKTISETVIK